MIKDLSTLLHGLPAGEYSVRVYDNNIISHPTDTAAAYEHSQLLHIHISPSRHITSSTVFSAGKPLMQLCLQMLVSLVHKGYSTSLFLNSLVLSNSVTPSVVFMSAGI